LSATSRASRCAASPSSVTRPCASEAKAKISTSILRTSSARMLLRPVS